uniref:Uncharacterized protein n=1 Tax=Rhizophora mucronata TaxID=61149 RepID=A0A2P2KJ80_RHIMU
MLESLDKMYPCLSIQFLLRAYLNSWTMMEVMDVHYNLLSVAVHTAEDYPHSFYFQMLQIVQPSLGSFQTSYYVLQ